MESDNLNVNALLKKIKKFDLNLIRRLFGIKLIVLKVVHKISSIGWDLSFQFVENIKIPTLPYTLLENAKYSTKCVSCRGSMVAIYHSQSFSPKTHSRLCHFYDTKKPCDKKVPNVVLYDGQGGNINFTYAIKWGRATSNITYGQ